MAITETRFTDRPAAQTSQSPHGPQAPSAAETRDAAEEGLGTSAGAEALVEEVLVEEISIDGMCGVY